MLKKIILWLAILITMMAWPISIIKNHPKIETNLVTLGGISKASGKYIKNLLIMTSLNNYFFGNNPQVDMGELAHREKFPYIAIIPFLVGVYISIKNKKYVRLWFSGLIIVLMISIFNNLDGWDVLMYPVIGIITIDGLKEIYRYKYGWFILSLITVIGLTEIARLFT